MKTVLKEEYLTKWQGLLDLASEMLALPSVLLARLDGEHLDIALSSRTDGNPFMQGERFLVAADPCSEAVIRSKAPLEVSAAAREERWKDSACVKYGMASYVGLPVCRQDGSVYGVFCAMDRKPGRFGEMRKRFMATILELMELDLKAASEEERRRKAEEERRRQADEAVEAVEKKLKETSKRIGRLFETSERSRIALLSLMEDEKSARERIQNLNRLYSVLSKCNETIYRTQKKFELLKEICRITVDEGGFRMSWIGLLDESGIRPLCSSGYEDGFLSLERFPDFSVVGEKFPIGAAVETRKCVVCNDIRNEQKMAGWRVEAIKRNYLSTAVVPFVRSGNVSGVLCVYASTPGFFDDDGVKLLDEVGQSVSYALDMIDKEKMRKDLEEQFLQVQKMEAVSRLAGGVAHDFNNLIQVISGYSQLLHAQFEEGDARRDDVAQIKEAARRAAELTSQLLAFSRRRMIEKKLLDLNSVISNSEKILQRFAGVNTAITYDLRKLPPVMADSTQMEQVLMNLVLNAKDAMPEGGTIRISTSCIQFREEDVAEKSEMRAGRFACLSVSDTGSGMDGDTLKHLFEPFFTTKGPGRGTGLGLATIYGIIRQHEGFIDVRSAPGQGATFRICLPAVQIEEPEIKIEEGARQIEAAPAPAGGRERILLVEDEKGVRIFAAKVLEANGYTVEKAASAEEALVMFEKDKNGFDLLFSDIILPDMNGFSMAERILALNPSIKVLFTSGYTDERSRGDEIREKGFRLLQKPYKIDDLLGEVRKAIDAPKPS